MPEPENQDPLPSKTNSLPEPSPEVIKGNEKRVKALETKNAELENKLTDVLGRLGTYEEKMGIAAKMPAKVSDPNNPTKSFLEEICEAIGL